MTQRRRILRPQDRASLTKSRLQSWFGPTGSPAHRQPVFPVDTIDSLVVHCHSFSPQKHVQAPVAEATSLLSQLPQPLS